MYMNSRIMISTTAELPGYRVCAYKKLVFDRVVVGAGALTEFFAAFSDTFGGRAGKTEDRLDDLYRHLISGITQQAANAGANAIIGFSVDIDEVSGKGSYMFMISGTGTAVVVEPERTAEVINTAAKEADVWKCIRCGSINDASFRFCPECGETRHNNWLCSACGSKNPSHFKFCPECGKPREDSEEIIVSEDASAALPAIENLASLAEEAAALNSSAEILNLLRTRFEGCENEDVLYLISVIKNKAALEKSYGNSKADSLRTLNAFVKHDGKVFDVDTANEILNCPVCGASQRSTREFCHSCSALFRK